MTADPRATGECVVSWWDDPIKGRVRRLDRADLNIEITDEVLSELAAAGRAGEGVFVVECDNATARYALRTRRDDRETWTATRIGRNPLEHT